MQSMWQRYYFRYMLSITCRIKFDCFFLFIWHIRLPFPWLFNQEQVFAVFFTETASMAKIVERNKLHTFAYINALNLHIWSCFKKNKCNEHTSIKIDPIIVTFCSTPGMYVIWFAFIAVFAIYFNSISCCLFCSFEKLCQSTWNLVYRLYVNAKKKDDVLTAAASSSMPCKWIKPLHLIGKHLNTKFFLSSSFVR